MGFPTINRFDKNFIERTRKNLEESEKFDNDFTFLINTLVGLLILPNEKLKRGVFRKYDPFKKKVKDVPALKNMFTNRKITIVQNREVVIDKAMIFSNDGTPKKILDTPVHELLSKIRNSIAHFQIEPTRSGDKWEGILLKNEYRGNQTLHLYLTQRELKELALYISGKYLSM